MSAPQRLEQLEELFNQAVDLNPEERKPLLESLRDESPTLCAEVERLLAREDEARGLSAAGPILEAVGPTRDDTWVGDADDSSAGAPLPTGFDSYRLTRRIGSGGMGDVYEAVQTEPIERRVALKVLERRADSARVLARFDAERRTLGLMSHPNIATVYGAGTSSEGRPFFAMEFVEGADITTFCDRERLAIDERLRLFIDVCDAVHHAHQKGIIHRDLKPSNILISSNGDGHDDSQSPTSSASSGTSPRATVKVIDFGIAKAIGDESAGGGLTHHGEAVGTPDYMSPEQARGEIDAIDTRSDVYSLGLILYELLTGHRAFAGRSLSRYSRHSQSPDSDAAKPSSRVGESSVGRGETNEIASRRATTGSQLARRLGGDLDWITLRALAPDAENRYPSADALRGDLVRHLGKLPVEAGPPGLRYRAGKFVKRHRGAVLVAAVLAVTLAAGIVGTTMGLLRARAAEAEARSEAITATRVTDVLMEIFKRTSPEQTDGRELTALGLLDQASERIRGQLEDAPLAKTRLLRTLGQVYNNLGEYERSRELIEEALELIRTPGTALGGEGELELARCLRDLAVLERRLDNGDAAEPLYRESLAIQERLLGKDDPSLGPLLNELALLLKNTAPEESLALYQRTYDLIVADGGEGGGNAAIVLSNMGAIQFSQADFEGAKTAWEGAYPTLEKMLGANDPRVATAAINLGVVYAQLGQHQRSADLIRTTITKLVDVLGQDHPATLKAGVDLAIALRGAGEIAEALSWSESAYEDLLAKLGPTHHSTIRARSVHAKDLFLSGAIRRAEALLAPVNLVDLSPPAYSGYVQSRFTLIELLLDTNRPEEALTIADEILASPLKDSHPFVAADAHWMRASVLAATDAPSQTLNETLTRAREASHNRPLKSRHYLEAKVLAYGGKYRDALVQLELALEHGMSQLTLTAEPVFEGVRALDGWSDFEARLRAAHDG